jgi:hypothetical protein
MKTTLPNGKKLDILPRHKRAMLHATIATGGFKLLFKYINWGQMAQDFHHKILSFTGAKKYRVKLLTGDTYILPETGDLEKIFEMLKNNQADYTNVN